MVGMVELEVHEIRNTGAMERIIKRERWPGEVVGGQRVQCVPLVTPGQHVPANQPIARLERQLSPVQALSGSERRDEVVMAGLNGHVLGITPRGGVFIESHATVVSGALGVGNQVAGILATMHVRDESGISGEMSKLPTGAILVIPEPLTFTVLRRAVISGVIGIIGSSIVLSDLEGFVRTDLLSLLASTNMESAQAHMPSLTLMLTEGIGQIPMAADTFEVLQRHQGEIALLSGLTSTRYHITPEVLISSSEQQSIQGYSLQKETEHQSLGIGTRVRVVCGTQEGAAGTIEYFFMHEQVFPSGVMSRAVRLRLDDGTLLMVPLIHVQRLDM